MTRRWMLMAAALLGACGEAPQASAPAAPQARGDEGPGVRDPLAFVQAVYGRYARATNGDAPEVPQDVYSPRLRAALANAAEPLAFDPWVNGQDWELQGLIIQEAPPRAPDRRLIAARFRNAGAPEAIGFEFVRADRRWLLDDVVREPQGQSEGWRLTALLAGAGAADAQP